MENVKRKMEKAKRLDWKDRAKIGPSAYPRGIRGHQLLMLDFMSSKGYEVQFERDVYNAPLSSEGILADPTRTLIGHTRARVYLHSKLKIWRDGDRKGEKPKPLREAVSYCSSDDQFNKRVGNINATAKVMRDMGLSREFATPLRAGKKLRMLAARGRRAARKAQREAGK